tara:strand:+ start:262 stop:1383 length:1122 start_codon:yes stop_codon:yes gene_type:complete
MAYIGNIPAEKYQTLQKQSFTTSATDTYTLDYAVTNPQDLALFINNVRQNPNDAYSVSNTTLTLSSAITSSDTMYAVFLGRAVETIAPATGSVTGNMMSYPLTNFSSTGIDDNADATAITIDSSENVLVGKTSLEYDSNTGIVLRNDGFISCVRDDGNVTDFNRLNSNGEVVRISKDGTTLGGFGANGNEIYFFSQTHGHGVRFAEEFVPTDATGGNNDNDIDLGKSGIRWRTVFAGTGSINTSDENEKQSIQPLTSSEMNVAKRLSALFRNYKFNDAVEQKGDNARIHTGIIAQDVQQAFTDEGLDASNYALWCSDTWYQNSDGDIKNEPTEGYVEKTRLAIRYSELFSFIQAYNDQRFTELETRIATLENA